MNIIQRINSEPTKFLSEDAVDDTVDEIVNYYDATLSRLATYAYSPMEVEASVARKAFREIAREELTKGFKRFMIKAEYWRDKRDIDPYLRVCIRSLANRLKNDKECAARSIVPVCPACRIYGERIFLTTDGKNLRCTNCTHRLNEIETLKGLDAHQLRALETEKYLRKICEIHSKLGHRCPDCSRFIPDSFTNQFGARCMYDDCAWFGSKNDMTSMNHPVGFSTRYLVSLDKGPTEDSTITMSNLIGDNKPSAFDELHFEEKIRNDYALVESVIAEQIESINRNEGQNKSKLKLFMYKAFQNMLKNHPDDMLLYLVHRRHNKSSDPIQTRLFQEFVQALENAIPFTLTRGGVDREIETMLDPTLKIFLGRSEFIATIRDDGTIPNNTKEIYIGGRKSTNFGPCFIGYLVDVIDLDTNESYLSQVDSYTFIQVNMPEELAGRKVKVIHFRIPSHYEMGGLVYLQRIRKRIVDSIFFRKNGRKRKAGE